MSQPDLTRAEQIADALAICEGLRSQGWAKVVIAVTRGGTYRVEAEAAGEAPSRQPWSTGRERRARTV